MTFYASDLGLFSKAIDQTTGGQHGEFSQAFTPIGDVNRALRLDRRIERFGLVD